MVAFLHEIPKHIKRISPRQWAAAGILFALIVFLGTLIARQQNERDLVRQAQYRAQVRLLTRATDYQAKLPEVEDKLRQDPNNRTLAMDMALAYYNTQQYEKAIDAYKWVLKLDENSTTAHNGLGNVYRDLAIASDDKSQRGHFLTEAEVHYREAIRADRAFIIAYSNLAQMLAEYADRSIAQLVVEEGLKQKQDNPELTQLKRDLFNSVQ